MDEFNEATRVQIPAMVHLTRIGYSYFGKITEDQANTVFDPSTNILLEVFKSKFEELNPANKGEYHNILQSIRQELDNDDLGRSFYKRLRSESPIRLIDFDNPQNNVFHFTAEFTCKNGLDEFRPDITLFVNGLPLCFIEVKHPNNHEGMVAESRRMNEQRFPNRKFRRFINITQLMIFSNNMEYSAEGGIVPIQGVFYCTSARKSAPFNCFREENPSNDPIAPYNRLYPYKQIDPEVEKKILSDFNCQVIRNTPEYNTNLDAYSPTNRVLTSMCSPERLLFILKYGIAYVNMEREVDGKIETTDQKHIMRYQQMFASLAVLKHLEDGARSGVIWHTQGSGKTALSYFLTYILTDYYSKKNKVAKFYFIVDRLDLLEQASQEFEARGLVVTTANSRAELMAQFRKNQSLQGHSGQAEITVVNIQRFAEDKDKVDLPSYATNLQRIFIVDEAHRGYKPGGCFLANLFDADPNSIKIALTGTPLLKEECASIKVFDNYFHTYYYDRSIADGYTLKIIREDIETSYREHLNDVYQSLDTLVQKREITKDQIIEHPTYVMALADYISKDLRDFRNMYEDQTLGGMVICETSEQARRLFAAFEEKRQNALTAPFYFNAEKAHSIAADPQVRYKSSRPLVAKLVLYDSDDKETRKQIIKDFKKNMTVDILIVFNMLLTGFDAPRLKRLYFGRKLKDHNLLQALTRVNRPYKDIRYGYVIDFADIKKNFEETNEAYLRELNRFNDPEQVLGGKTVDTFNQIMESSEEIISQMKDVREKLFYYTTDNVETFCKEISSIEDKQELLNLKKALTTARDYANIVRTFGDDELKKGFAKLEVEHIPEMLKEVQHHIDMINQKEMFEISDSTKKLVYDAMLNIQFNFSKIGEEELKLISGGDELKKMWNQVIRSLAANTDQDDPEFISLREAFIQRFKEYKFAADSIAKYNQETKALDDILKKLTELQKKNDKLLTKYNGDVKFANLHKRIHEENERRKKEHKDPLLSQYDSDIHDVLIKIKKDIDQKVYDRNDILKKDEYFERTVMSEITNCLNGFKQLHPSIDDYIFIQSRIARQYLNQYKATYSA